MTAPLTDREPVALGVGTLAGLVDLGLALCAAFDWVNLTNEQTVALIAFVSAVSLVIGSVLRESVWSPATVAKLSGPPTTEPLP